MLMFVTMIVTWFHCGGKDLLVAPECYRIKAPRFQSSNGFERTQRICWASRQDVLQTFSIKIYCQAFSHDNALKDPTHDSSPVMAASQWHGSIQSTSITAFPRWTTMPCPMGLTVRRRWTRSQWGKLELPVSSWIFWSQCRSRGAFHAVSKK